MGIVILGMQPCDMPSKAQILDMIGIRGDTTFGRVSKKPTNFKIYLAERWGKELELDNGTKFTVTKINSEEIIVALASGCEADEVYLGVTNDFSNEGFAGTTRIKFKFKMEMLPSHRYTPVLYGTVYA